MPNAHWSESHPQKMTDAKGRLFVRPPPPSRGGVTNRRAELVSYSGPQTWYFTLKKELKSSAQGRRPVWRDELQQLRKYLRVAADDVARLHVVRFA